jgi:hypothetical protein
MAAVKKRLWEESTDLQVEMGGKEGSAPRAARSETKGLRADAIE